VYFLAMLGSFSYSFWAPTVVREALGASPLAVGLITGAMSAVAATRTADPIASPSGRVMTRPLVPCRFIRPACGAASCPAGP